VAKDTVEDELVACRCCGEDSFIEIWNCGPQPLCFDYGKGGYLESVAVRFPFGVGECRNCTVIQLSHPVPPNSLVPRLSWVKNKEPEDHLSRLASDLAYLVTDPNFKVLLISSFDEALGKRLKERVPVELTRLNPSVDLGIAQAEPGQALIQKAVTDLQAELDRPFFGKFDLVVCCRMLEHAHQVHEFVAKVTKFLNPDGRLLFEIPESSKSLQQGDVGMLWEEHTNYFTEHSMRHFAAANSLAIEKIWVYEYLQEDALAVLVKQNCRGLSVSEHAPRKPSECARYAKRLSRYANASTRLFQKLKENHGNLVVLGAGHRAIMFINLFQLADLITAVIDDDERKQGLFIPGTQIPIEASSRFSDRAIGVCLFAIGIESEDRVRRMLDTRFDRSLEYYSISPDSPLALPFFQ